MNPARVLNTFALLAALHTMLVVVATSGCVSNDRVSFVGIARQSSSTLDDINDLEEDIVESNLTPDTLDAVLTRTNQIRAMVLAIDVALVAVAGRDYEPQQARRINAAAETAHRHIRSFVDRSPLLFTRSVNKAADWDSFESEADVLLDNLQRQIDQ